MFPMPAWPFLISGFIVEILERASLSFLRSWSYYTIRVRDNLQPSTGAHLDLFNPVHQLYISTFTIACYLVGCHLLVKKSTHWSITALTFVFDIIATVISFYIFVALLKYKVFDDSMLLCNPLFLEERANQRGFHDRYSATNLFLLFYLIKIFESLHSWILIMQGFASKVSTFHLLCRVALIVIICLIFPFDHNGDMYVAVLVNSFVHGLIYCHYLFKMFGISCFFSSYLSHLQFFQFLLICVHAFLTYRVGPTCGSPDFAKILVMILSGILLVFSGGVFVFEV